MENQESVNPCYGYMVNSETRASMQVPPNTAVTVDLRPVIEVSKSSIIYWFKFIKLWDIIIKKYWKKSKKKV